MDLISAILDVINTGGVIAVLLIVWRNDARRAERSDLREQEMLDRLLNKLLEKNNNGKPRIEP